MKAREVNFDGSVGLTHHYAGLSPLVMKLDETPFSGLQPETGGKAGAAENEGAIGRGFSAGGDPLQERPNVAVLRQLGFSGTDEQVVEKAEMQTPHLLSAGEFCLLNGWPTRRPSHPLPIRWMARSI